MKKRNFYVVGLFLVFIANLHVVHAQGPPTRYDDKKEAADVKFAIKANVFSLISGELPLSFEYKFIKHLGVEVGAGIILPYYVNLEFFNRTLGFDKDNHVKFTNKKAGYSLSFSLNLYTWGGTWGDIVFNPFFHFRHYSTVNVFNAGLEFGYRGVFFDGLLFEIGPKIYWRGQKSLDDIGTLYYKKENTLPVDISFFIKIGYAF